MCQFFLLDRLEYTRNFIDTFTHIFVIEIALPEPPDTCLFLYCALKGRKKPELKKKNQTQKTYMKKIVSDCLQWTNECHKLLRTSKNHLMMFSIAKRFIEKRIKTTNTSHNGWATVLAGKLGTLITQGNSIYICIQR